MVRVHTTLGPDVVEALTAHVESNGATHTEVLAEAFVTYGDGLRAGVEEAELARYEALGFRPPRTAEPARGRMGATFYMSTKARESLDEAPRSGDSPAAPPSSTRYCARRSSTASATTHYVVGIVRLARTATRKC